MTVRHPGSKIVEFFSCFFSSQAQLKKVFAFLPLMLLFTLLLSGSSAGAGELPYDMIWTRQIGVTGDDKGFSVATNDNGEIYISGYTDDRINGFPNDFKRDLFLIKYDSGGTKLWQEEMGTNKEDVAYSVAVRKDSAGNFYVAGRTKGNIEEPGSKQGGFDVFLIKYDAAGTAVWKKQLGTKEDDMANSVAVDGAGNAYVVGKTNGSFADYGYTNAGGADLFIVKYDVNGNVAWLRQIGTPADEDASSAALDPAGNIIVTGHTYGNLDGAGAGGADFFVMKYDGNGNLLWKNQKGTGNDDKAYGITSDSSGNICISGMTRGDLAGTGAGFSDIFLAKYDGNGNLLWARQTGTAVEESGNSVALDADGNAYVAGSTTGSFTGYANSGLFDIVIVKYDPAGNQLWTKQMGTAADDEAYDAALDGTGNVYITGYTRGILDGTSVTGADVFLMKLTKPLTATVTPAAGSHCTINPSTPQSVKINDTVSFTITPDLGYHIDLATGCGGMLSGSIFTTGPVTADCTVTAVCAANTHTVTAIAGPGGSITPTSKVVNHGDTASFTVTPNTGYQIVSVTGCGGNLSGTTYTTGPITADCTINAAFANQPDLTAYGVTGPASITTETQMTVSGTVKNQGSNVGGFLCQFYLVNSAGTKTYLGSEIYLSSLAGGAEQLLTATVSIPGTIANGTYWIGLAVDSRNNNVVESDESNNHVPGNQVVISRT